MDIATASFNDALHLLNSSIEEAGGVFPPASESKAFVIAFHNPELISQFMDAFSEVLPSMAVINDRFLAGVHGDAGDDKRLAQHITAILHGYDQKLLTKPVTRNWLAEAIRYQSFGVQYIQSFPTGSEGMDFEDLIRSRTAANRSLCDMDQKRISGKDQALKETENSIVQDWAEFLYANFLGIPQKEALVAVLEKMLARTFDHLRSGPVIFELSGSRELSLIRQRASVTLGGYDMNQQRRDAETRLLALFESIDREFREAVSFRGTTPALELDLRSIIVSAFPEVSYTRSTQDLLGRTYDPRKSLKQPFGGMPMVPFTCGVQDPDYQLNPVSLEYTFRLTTPDHVAYMIQMAFVQYVIRIVGLRNEHRLLETLHDYSAKIAEESPHVSLADRVMDAVRFDGRL